MDTVEQIGFGFLGGVVAFIILLLIPLLSKFFGAKVKLPSTGQLVVQLLLATLLGALYGVVGAVGALFGEADTVAKAIFMGGGSQALLKEGFATVKASAQQPEAERQPEKSVSGVVKAIASSGQSIVYRDWR